MASEQQIVKDLLSQFYDARANNATPLGVDMLEQMRGKNGGYPRFMYHQHHTPVSVTNKEQESALSQRGYVRNYIRHNYPRTLYRRNMATIRTRVLDSKEYEELPKFADFVETTAAKSAEHEAALLSDRVPAQCSAWVTNMNDLPEADNGPTEDPKVTIARLRGQMEALQAGMAESLPMPDGALTSDERHERKRNRR